MIMLSIGLIGNIKLMDTYLKQIRENPNIHIVGKSTSGFAIEHDDHILSIPEMNRIELIERSDIMLVNRFSLLPFDLICKSIKKVKHIFAADYPFFSIDECKELVKLTDEAKAIIQITNPLFNLPAVRWIKDNIKTPAYWDISFFEFNSSNSEALIKNLLMLNRIIGDTPKKIGAVSFNIPSIHSEFINLRVDFGNATVVNLNLGKQLTDEFNLKIYSSDKIVTYNFNAEKLISNNSQIDLNCLSYSNEFDQFIENILSKTFTSRIMHNYLSVLQSFQQIKTKLSQFSDI